MTPKTHIITASTGIGAETARLLGYRGHSIFVVSRTPGNCEALVDELKSAGAKADGYSGDLVDPRTAPEAVAACLRSFGRIDGLFNVAGISGRRFGDGPLHECTEEGWETVIRTNLSTQYRMCREVLKVMMSQERDPEDDFGGVILNMTSILAHHPEAGHFSAIAYAASKGGIISMTKAAAAYYAHAGIRINAIAPALVRTAMSARASEDEVILRFIEKKQPLHRGLIPVEGVAATCAFLLGEGSASITGKVLEVDAGWALA